MPTPVDAAIRRKVYGDYLSARFAADHHDLAEAAKFFRASLDSDPNNPQLLTFAFFYAASAGQIDEAAELADRLAALSPDDRAARLTLAVAALKHRDYKTARAADREIRQRAVHLVHRRADRRLGRGRRRARRRGEPKRT